MAVSAKCQRSPSFGGDHRAMRRPRGAADRHGKDRTGLHTAGSAVKARPASIAAVIPAAAPQPGWKRLVQAPSSRKTWTPDAVLGGNALRRDRLRFGQPQQLAATIAELKCDRTPVAWKADVMKSAADRHVKPDADSIPAI